MIDNKEENVILKKLSTMLPIEVFKEFDAYAKTNATLTMSGKHDYGVAIRQLLEKADQFTVITKAFQDIEVINDKVTKLQESLEKLEGKQEQVEPITFGSGDE